MAQYRTSTNEMLDAICFKYYSGRAGATEMVYEVNTGLAAYGPQLPSALVIILPDLPPVETAKTVKLWD